MAMNDEDYFGTQQRILMFARLVRTEDLEGFLQRVGTAHALGPILDPTRYRDAMSNLQSLERLAAGLRHFQKVVEEVALEAADRG